MDGSLLYGNLEVRGTVSPDNNAHSLNDHFLNVFALQRNAQRAVLEVHTYGFKNFPNFNGEVFMLITCQMNCKICTS